MSSAVLVQLTTYTTLSNELGSNRGLLKVPWLRVVMDEGEFAAPQLASPCLAPTALVMPSFVCTRGGLAPFSMPPVMRSEACRPPHQEHEDQDVAGGISAQGRQALDLHRHAHPEQARGPLGLVALAPGVHLRRFAGMPRVCGSRATHVDPVTPAGYGLPLASPASTGSRSSTPLWPS